MLPFQREQWQTFFRQNPQIRSFSCDYWYSTSSTDRPIKEISKNAPNLTRLYISLRGIGHLNGTYYDLNELCKNKRFKCLELQFTGNSTGKLYLMRHAKILADMEVLHTLHFTDMVLTKEMIPVIALLTELKQMNFVQSTFVTEFAEYISKILPNLEAIYSNTSNDFTPFIRNAPKLKKIEMAHTEFDKLNLGWGPLWLNDERTKISNACPLTIYVKSISTKYSLIETGIITIRPVSRDKRILTNVKNTFVNF